MPLPLLTRAAPSRPSLATRTAAITRPRGGSTASQLLRRSSLRRSQRPPLTAPHLDLGALGVRDAISVPGRPPPTPVRSMPGPKATQLEKLANISNPINAAARRRRGHEAGAQRSPLTCVAAHLRRSSLRAAHARSHCVADGARSLRRNAGEAARVCFSRVRFRSRFRCLLVHAPCACAVRVCAGVTHVAGLRRHG